MTDIKILDLAVHDNQSLERAITEGFRIQHAIPYEEKYFENKMKYTETGSTYYENKLTSCISKIKYVLERAPISKLLHG